MADRLVSVAVPVPALGMLTYYVPLDMPMPSSGARVVVPVGPRTMTGVVLGEAAAADTAFTIKPLTQILDVGAFVPADVIKLTEWVSEYYLAGPGATLSAALPPHGLTSRRDRFKTVRIVTLTAAAQDEFLPKLSVRQHEAIELLRGSPAGLTTAELAKRGIAAAALKKLMVLGLIVIREERVDRDPFEHAVSASAAPVTRETTPDQQKALNTLLPLALAKSFAVALMHGVTGSGKTEVYMRLAEAVRKRGRGVLMLVPEIALTPQVAGLFRARFGSAVAIQHSGLSDGERHDQWHRIRRREVSVVIGTRSAVFAPLRDPGLIIVDEEHDTSYKQDETPRYHGRDVAIMRGKFSNALVLLGSATPTIESYANALDGKYTLVSMDKRVLDRPLAKVEVVNMRDEIAQAGDDVVLSRALVAAIALRLERKEQSLILLNRRGFATSVICRQCSAVLDCPNCSISLTVHRSGRDFKARCHYCNFVKLVPKACEACAAPYLERIGFGTERVEAEVRKAFPEARLARVDRDTVRRKGSLVETLAKVAGREIDILIGTQMAAKGHHFPNLTLVAVVDADLGLNGGDLRAAERTFQLLYQVAGRAGRHERPGRALIQTHAPEHPVMQALVANDRDRFVSAELAGRSGAGMPPYGRLASLIISGPDPAAVDNVCAAIARRAPHQDGVTILGPSVAPMSLLRGRHRRRFLLKTARETAVQPLLHAWLAQIGLPGSVRLQIDVDPYSFL